ncbi:hypothetical protein V8E53_007996 [Lactarius tabidus]
MQARAVTYCQIYELGATTVSTPREEGKRFTSLDTTAGTQHPAVNQASTVTSRFTSPTTCQVDGNREAYVLLAAVGLRCTGWIPDPSARTIPGSPARSLRTTLDLDTNGLAQFAFCHVDFATGAFSKCRESGLGPQSSQEYLDYLASSLGLHITMARRTSFVRQVTQQMRRDFSDVLPHRPLLSVSAAWETQQWSTVNCAGATRFRGAATTWRKLNGNEFIKTVRPQPCSSCGI